MEAKRIGNIYGFDGGNYAGNVFDKEQLSPTISTMQGGNREPMIIDEVLGGINYKVSEDFQKGILPDCSRSILANNDGAACIVAMRGRNPDNPSDRTTGIKTEQRLEPNSQGICNTLTSVQKDNLVLEKQGITTKGKKQDVASTILAGYERTNMTGFNADNAVLETNERFFRQALETLEENDCEVGDTINAYNKSVDKSGVSPTITTRPEGFKTAILPVVQKVGQISSEGSQCGTVVSDKGLAPNLVAGTHGYANNHIQTQYRIRKLTPKECWRLMDFTDEDFEKAEKVNSNSQLYKQAGNSIVKNVLMAIFGQMIEGKENIYKER